MLIEGRTDAQSVARGTPMGWVQRIPSETWLVAGITAVGAAIRFATLSSQSYWIDEATTVHELHLSFAGMLSAVQSGESSPPLYFVVAWLWAKVFGTGEVGLRSLSALLGTALVPIGYLSGRELVSRRAGALVALLVAINPFMIWYSQEARAYMLLGALSGLSFLFFVRALRTGSGRDLAWWAASSGLALLTHFFAGFLVAPEAVWLLFVLRTRRATLAVAALAAVQAALVPLLVTDASHPLQGWITQFSRSIRIQQVPIDFSLGTLYQTSLVTAGISGSVVLAGIVVALLAVGGEWKERRGAAVAATIAASVIFVPLLIALAGRDYYVARNMLGAWLPLVVLIAAACAVPRARFAGAALAAVLLGGCVYADARIQSSPAYQRPNWRAVAAALGTGRGPRAIVAYDGPFATEPLAIYLRGTPWRVRSGVPVTVSEVDIVGSRWQSPPQQLPFGVRLFSRRTVDDFLIVRFAVDPAWHASPAAIQARAATLLVPASARSSLLVPR